MSTITPQLSVDALPSWTPTHPSCPICLQSTSTTPLSPDEIALHSLPHNTWVPDHPVRLPCSHVFGIDCLAAWFKINPNCPMCRQYPGRVASQEEGYYGKRFQAVGTVSVRELLTRAWDRRSEVLVRDDVNAVAGTVGCAARMVVVMGVRITLGLRRESGNQFVYPGVRFPLGADDAENFQTWLPDYMAEFQTLNHLDASTNTWLADVTKMLESSLVAAYYASICRVFKQCNFDQTQRFKEGRMRTTYSADYLLSRIETAFGEAIVDHFYDNQMAEGEFDGVERSEEDKLYRVAQLAARAVVETERRKTEITLEQERMRKVLGFRYLDERQAFWRGDAESGYFLIEGDEVEVESESEDGL